MNINEELAEVAGMFAADGCIQEQYICMWGNITEDKDYYDKFICPMFSNLLKRKVVAHEKKSNSVYGFYICSQDAINFFKELGFKRRKTYDVTVPEAILKSNDQKIWSAFIRGFTDCDGCISFMKRKGKYSEFKLKYNTYPRITIRVVSPYIIEGISEMLIRLNVRHTVYTAEGRRGNEQKAYILMVRGENRINDWVNKIGFSNPAQFSRYKVWKKFGTSPAKSTIQQRKLILEGKLSPFDLSEIKTTPTGFEPATY